jgi:predicted nucleic acid-binding protein
LDATPLIEGDADVATVYGDLAAAYARRGRPRPENDAWIAACCLVHDLPLMTLNIKDFADFEANDGLRLVRV